MRNSADSNNTAYLETISLEDGRVVLSINEGICDEIFQVLGEVKWGVDMFDTGQFYLPASVAWRHIVHKYYNQGLDNEDVKLELDDQSKQLIGAILAIDLPQRMSASMPGFISEVTTFLKTADPVDVYIAHTGKFSNPLAIYISKIRDHMEQAAKIFHKPIDKGMMIPFVRETIMPVIALALKYESMKKDDLRMSDIYSARVDACEWITNTLQESKYTDFIFDLTGEDNVPYTSELISMFWKVSHTAPMGSNEALCIFLESIQNLLNTPAFNPKHWRSANGDVVQANRNILLQILRHQYGFIGKISPNVLDKARRDSFLLNTLEQITGKRFRKQDV